MHTDKTSVLYLIHRLEKAGVKDVIISPGSRNAPIIQELVRRKTLKLYMVPDERVAGFRALGMSLKTKRPTVVVCTSGSAVLNYLPAVSEAYYQQIPMIVVSADRPYYRLNKGEGQTIEQKGALKNFILDELNVTIDEEQSNYEALDKSLFEIIRKTRFPLPGPVHINMEFEEPLYQTQPSISLNYSNFDDLLPEDITHSELSIADVKTIVESKRIMVLCGQRVPDHSIEEELNIFSERPQVIVLTETTSNLHGEHFISSIDKTLMAMDLSQSQYAPDLLISIGDAVVSKRIKKYLRKNKPKVHWHIHPNGDYKDTFDVGVQGLKMRPDNVLAELNQITPKIESDYRNYWLQAYLRANTWHQKFLKNQVWSDLKAFEIILDQFNSDDSLHVANSSPIRYHQLFEKTSRYSTYCNRGTSGIDGSLSTAVGFAEKANETVWLITGDMSFIYDSNAFWSDQLPDLKVILLNNGGGGIFSIIPGPSKVPEYQRFFTAKTKTGFKSLCAAYHLNYLYANSIENLKNNLNKLSDLGGTSVLEVDTRDADSAKILHNYFKAIKHEKLENH